MFIICTYQILYLYLFQQNKIDMKNFNTLLNETTNGIFVYEPNELVEVKVNYPASSITVEYYRTKNQLAPYNKETYHSLHGMFGSKTVEQQFNEILARF